MKLLALDPLPANLRCIFSYAFEGKRAEVESLTENAVTEFAYGNLIKVFQASCIKYF